VGRRRGGARGRQHGGRQRERVAGVVDERRREAGARVTVGVGERVDVLRPQRRDLPLDVRRVQREPRALPALEARVPVVLDLVVRPPGQLRGTAERS
jgi:hypothetical protein